MSLGSLPASWPSPEKPHTSWPGRTRGFFLWWPPNWPCYGVLLSFESLWQSHTDGGFLIQRVLPAGPWHAGQVPEPEPPLLTFGGTLKVGVRVSPDPLFTRGWAEIMQPAPSSLSPCLADPGTAWLKDTGTLEVCLRFPPVADGSGYRSLIN